MMTGTRSHYHYLARVKSSCTYMISSMFIESEKYDLPFLIKHRTIITTVASWISDGLSSIFHDQMRSAENSFSDKLCLQGQITAQPT